MTYTSVCGIDQINCLDYTRVGSANGKAVSMHRLTQEGKVAVYSG